jgi:hypothetical protein
VQAIHEGFVGNAIMQKIFANAKSNAMATVSFGLKQKSAT